MGTMHSWMHLISRSFPVVLAFAAAGCVSTDEPKDVTNIVSVGVGAAEEQPDVASDDATRRVRNTAESVKRYEELRLQGNSRAMIALRTTIARTIDEDFDDFRNMALDGQSYLHRNMAVKCLGFANERHIGDCAQFNFFGQFVFVAAQNEIDLAPPVSMHGRTD